MKTVNQDLNQTGNQTLESLMETIGKLEFRRSVIAFVCRPEVVPRIRDMMISADLPSLGLFGMPEIGVEVLTDNDQPEPCIAFHDREALRVYLARNRACAVTSCGALGARWFTDIRSEFYCDSCKEKFNAMNRDLFGFDDFDFVKI